MMNLHFKKITLGFGELSREGQEWRREIQQ